MPYSSHRFSPPSSDHAIHLSPPPPRLLPTPESIVTHLDQFIVGQSKAKWAIARAVYNHFIGQAIRQRDNVDVGRHHVMLLGPTGCGKSYLVRKIADFLGVPVAFTSASGLVEAGYKGASVETVVRSLLDAAGGDPKLAERGIIFIDEIDKIRCASEDIGRDVSGEGVQQHLLTLLDGRISKGTDSNDHSAVDTSKVLFICAGAFVKLPQIVNKRLGRENERRVGFLGQNTGATSAAQGSRPVFDSLSKAITEDFQKFGMIPEIMGRFSTVAALHELDVDEYSRILADSTQNGPWQRHQLIARMHGIKLEISKSAMTELAVRASELGTGARGLQRLLGEAMNRMMQSWPALADQGVGRVVIDLNCVTSGECPQLIHGDREELRREDEELRHLAYSPFNQPGTHLQTTVNGITNTTCWSEDQIKVRLEQVEASLDMANTTGSARKWWQAFRDENSNRLNLVLRLAEELAMRKVTITDFFLSYVYSNTDNIQANLHYLDYTRLKKQEEQKRREAQAKAVAEEERKLREDQLRKRHQEFGTQALPPRRSLGPEAAPSEHYSAFDFDDEDPFEERDDSPEDRDETPPSDIPF